MQALFSKQNSNYIRNILIAICLFGCSLRIAYASYRVRIDKDAIFYIQGAKLMAKQTLSEEEQFRLKKSSVTEIQPLLPLYLTMAAKLGIDPEFAGSFLGILLGSLIPLLLFIITKKTLSSEKLALLAAFLAAIHPNLIQLSVRALRDTLYVPLVVIAITIAIYAVFDNKYWKWLLFSFVATLAIMARKEGIEIYFLFVLWSLYEIISLLIKKDKKIFKSIKILIFVSATYAMLVGSAQFAMQDTYYAEWSPMKVRWMKKILLNFYETSSKEVVNKDA